MVEENSFDLEELKQENLVAVEDFVRHIDFNIQEHLADFIANLCGVPTKEMLTSREKHHFVYARWLYWHSVHFINKESFRKMAANTEQTGMKFTADAIAKGCAKIGGMIARERMWGHRWETIKRAVSVKNKEFEKRLTEPPKITVIVPKGIKVEIKEDGRL